MDLGSDAMNLNDVEESTPTPTLFKCGAKYDLIEGLQVAASIRQQHPSCVDSVDLKGLLRFHFSLISPISLYMFPPCFRPSASLCSRCSLSWLPFLPPVLASRYTATEPGGEEVKAVAAMADASVTGVGAEGGADDDDNKTDARVVGEGEAAGAELPLPAEQMAAMPVRQKAIRKFITARQLLCIVGDGGAAGGDLAAVEAADVALVDRLMRQYEWTRGVNLGAGGGQREVQHGDELVVVSTHVCLSLIRRRERSWGANGGQAVGAGNCRWVRERLLEVAVMLERVLANSTFNFHVKLLLIYVYNKLGAFLPAVEHYNSLKIAHIQNDTMSQLMLAPALRCGFTEEAKRLAGDVIHMHVQLARDMPNEVKTAFLNSHYCQAVDMIQFQQRMQRSQQRAICMIELGNLHLHSYSSSLSEGERFLQDTCVTSEIRAQLNDMNRIDGS